MGVVYLGLDPELGRKLAIKLVRPHAGQGSDGGDSAARLMREAQALAKLSHPNVVAVHDVGTFRESLFIAMELVEGQTLAQWLKQQPDQKEILEVFAQAGQGLQAAHELGIVHRDFKPDNVLVGNQGRVRVVDFGLARAQQESLPLGATMPPASREALLASADLTQTGAIMGTPAYMAPEQHLGQSTDARTDQFSFCVALYEAAYGERPFAGEHLIALAANVVQGAIRPAPASTSVPQRIRAVLLRELRPTPADRYPSMADLLAALIPPAKRANRLLALLALLVLVAVGAVGYRLRSPPKVATIPPPEQRQVTFMGDVRGVALTPDGSAIAFMSGRRLLLQDLPAGEPRTLHDADSFEGQPAWSQDGMNVAFTAYSGAVATTLVAPRQGSPSALIKGGCLEVSWSPDGDHLACTSGNRELSIVPTRGGPPRVFDLGQGFTWIQGLAWSPSGAQIAFLTTDDKRWIVWAIGSDGAGRQKMIESESSIYDFQWDARGNALYVLRLSSNSPLRDLVRIGVDEKSGRVSGPEQLVLARTLELEQCSASGAVAAHRCRPRGRDGSVYPIRAGPRACKTTTRGASKPPGLRFVSQQTPDTQVRCLSI